LTTRSPNSGAAVAPLEVAQLPEPVEDLLSCEPPELAEPVQLLAFAKCVRAFGRVVYDAQRLLGSAVNNYWKLKAINSLGVANVPKEERKKIIDLMIGNPQIKEILLSTNF
jgi:hypothetical protein